MPGPSFPGGRIGVYQVQALLGAGGMGEVYRARDTSLERDVAIKILPAAFTGDPDRLSRFEREARLLAALNHPNIATIYGLEAAGERSPRAIVMELVEGETLAQRIARSPHGLGVDETLGFARQIAGALAAAHGKGIVHRDLKPANIMVSPQGLVKILDFGLAKMGTPAGESAAQLATATFEGTRQGVVLGTAAYMSPEQAQGRTLDGRSDVFSFGVVLYEMATGLAPFRGATMVETLAKVLESNPAGLRTVRADLPAPLASLVEQCLEKDRDRRPEAADVQARLNDIAQAAGVSVSFGRTARRRTVLMSLLGAAALASVVAGAWWYSGRDVRAARRRVPELIAAANRFDYDGFYRAARGVIPLLPDDLQVKQVWMNMTFPATIRSDPSGADVLIKGYSAANAEWIPIGRTPLQQIRVPFGATRVKVVKEGYVPFEGSLAAETITYRLDPPVAVPDGMVRVPASAPSVYGVTVALPDFWMDRFEVTNRQFKAFLDAGGYQAADYWKEPVVENGRTLTWAEAMTRFRDKTGRPGPSTWELGTFPEGQADVAVSGVSWHEAAAYATFAGKSLPTVYQWRAAAAGAGGLGGIFSDILAFSNFGMKGPAVVGSYGGIGSFGTYDMAGNVKEWCWNALQDDRTILGGGWNESSYKYLDLDAQPALHRTAAYGFRLVKNATPQPQPIAASAELRPRPRRDYSKETPADDATFEIIRGLYGYDSRALNARLDGVEETPEWRRETVTIDAAYASERIIVYLYLPKSAPPPYQPVVFFPGGDAPSISSSRDLRLTTVDFVARAGRALVIPVYKGTYERRVELTGPNANRDVTIASVKDFGRVIELIESRRDLDRERIGFYGDSRGAYHGVIITALEPRLKASVLLGGGLPGGRAAPEVDLLNFAPRVHVPTLMVSGRLDFLAPVETAQKPLFQLLGVPADRKRHALFDGGHAPSQLPDLIREILDWFDKYLGPVRPLPRV